MRDQRSIALLVRELENDLSFIKDAVALRDSAVRRAEGSAWADELDLMVLGSCLHSIYNAIEGYFLRVAKFFENNVDQQAWHRDLLDRMTLEIPAVRPSLVTDRGTAERIDELRRFRHLFRNLYKTRLNAAKLRIVDDAARGIYEEFLPMHQAFVQWLRTLADELGTGR